MRRILAQVRRRVEAGEPLEHIEAYLVYECPSLTENERAVLWMFAWTGADPATVVRLLGGPPLLTKERELLS